MSVTTKYRRHAAVFNTDVVDQITQMAVSDGKEVFGEAGGGQLYPLGQYILAGLPGAQFTTRGIAKALDQCGGLGGSIADEAAGLILYAQQAAAGATCTTGSNHRKYTFTAGLILPRTLRCEFGGNAELTYDVIPTSDGSTNPLAFTDSVALPTLGTEELFTLGPFKWGNEVLAQCKSLTIDFGITAAVEAADSDIFPSFASITSIQPTITLTGTDIQWLKSDVVPQAGLPGVASMEHISFTAAGLAWIEAPFDASGHAAAEATLQAQLLYDGSNAPLVIDTTADIV
jgi:hypothetical protein